MVNRSLRIEKKAGDSDPNVLLYPQNVTFANYFYFLWAPTLVYQINYPRTKKIRLRYTLSFMPTRHSMPPITLTHTHNRTRTRTRSSFVAKSFLEASATVLYTYAIFVRYVHVCNAVATT